MEDTTSHRRDRELQNLLAETAYLRGLLSQLSALSLRITANLDLPTVLQDVVDAACELTGARYGALGLFDAAGRIQQFITHGITQEERERIGDLPQGMGILGWLHHLQQPLRLADLSRHARSVGFPPNHPPMKTFLGVPLRHKDQPLGNLYLTEKAGGEEFTPEDETLLVLFAAQAAVAVHNARLQQQVSQHLRQVELLHALTQVSVSTLDLEEVLERSLPLILEGSSADAVEVWILDRDKGVLEQKALLADPREPFLERREFKLGEGLPGIAAHTLEPVIALDLAYETRLGRPGLVEAGYRAFRAFPLAFQGEPLGALCVACRDPHRLGRYHNHLLASMADELSIAVHNAQLHRQVQVERQRLDAILSNSPDGIIFVDARTGAVQANRRAQEMLDAPLGPEGSLEAALERHRDRDGAPVPLESHPLQRALRGEFISGEEYAVLREYGDSFPILASAAPIRDGAGAVLGAVVQFQDLTSVKEAQQRISELAAERGRLLELTEQERRRLERLVDISPVGVFVVEAPEGKVLLVNREAERIFGLAHQEGDPLARYEGAAVYRRPDGRAYPMEELPLHRALARGETVRADEVIFEFPDGHAIPALVNATPIYSTEGQLLGAIAIIQDITPLQELERLRNEFLGMVSHELRTPLTTIKGSAATVLGSSKGLDPVRSRELFEVIDEQADRLRDLVDNLLDLTRIEAGSLSVSLEPADLRQIIGEAQALFARSGDPHPLEVQAPQALPPVQADRHRVRQVLANLLSNAAKFSPEDKPITIAVEEGPVQVTVRVQDQGRGIGPEQLPYLFKKFSRLGEEHTAGIAGSGLGLAICKGIVEAHGGRIWVESPGPGRGSTFSFTLLATTESPQTPLSQRGDRGNFALDTTRRAEQLGRVRRSGERTRIVVVDDEARILRYLERTLEEAGYQAIATGDPSQVTRLVELEEPDLVLLDLMLPGTSGYDLLARIREFSGVPVIFLSARDRDEDAVQALRMGADDYITKPFSPSELLARIEAALRRRMFPDQMEARPPFVLHDLAINFAERRVTLKGEAVPLSATEYKLLYELASHAGLVLTHDQILGRVWGEEYAGEVDLIRSFIRNLRRKLGDDARSPRYIFTEPQVGYRMPRS